MNLSLFGIAIAVKNSRHKWTGWNWPSSCCWSLDNLYMTIQEWLNTNTIPEKRWHFVGWKSKIVLKGMKKVYNARCGRTVTITSLFVSLQMYTVVEFIALVIKSEGCDMCCRRIFPLTFLAVKCTLNKSWIYKTVNVAEYHMWFTTSMVT